ncbi:MAG TPA: trehalose-6-phosphate synthase [Pseudomonadales bacterium]
MTHVVERDISALKQKVRVEPVERVLPSRRLIVLTSRHPDPAAVASKGNSGGLVAALAPALERCRGTWIAGKPENEPTELTPRNRANGAETAPYRTVPVRYPAKLHEGYYAGLSNGVLWPLYHSMPHEPDKCRSSEWRDYCVVNRHFASVAAEQAQPGSFVWVHDYQLSLVPAMLRELTHGSVEIGFFLHTPFPGYDLFRILPWGRDVLRGMLGADLIGFHTEDYRRNFCDCVRRLLGVPCEANAGEVRLDGRTVKLRVIPVGVDAQAIYRLIDDPWVRHAAAQIKEKIGAERLLLGVDRMDYTKGIDRRVEAVDALLERYPEWRGRIVYAQIAVPSRTEVDAYRDLREEIEQLVGHVNGRWSDEYWSPVKMLCRSYPLRELVAWYLAADVALVTPYRDGMNLVAKEYCAANHRNPGVLVLSELTGAACELGDALMVNPHDLDGMTETIHRALKMPHDEACSRMQRLNQRIQACDAHFWVDTFLAEAGWRKRF